MVGRGDTPDICRRLELLSTADTDMGYSPNPIATTVDIPLPVYSMVAGTCGMLAVLGRRKAGTDASRRTTMGRRGDAAMPARELTGTGVGCEESIE
jgi:hypothetical protein